MSWGLKDDPGRGAVAGDRGRTPAARRPAVAGYGEERRPWSGRCGRGPRANSCGSTARSGWVRRGTTTLVGALWPGTEGELLRLTGPQLVRDERVGVGAGPTQMSRSETQRSRPKTHFLASRGRLEIKECPMCKRRPVHTCRRAGNWNVSPKSVDVAAGPAQAAMTQTAASPAGGRTETHGAGAMNRTAGWGTAASGREPMGGGRSGGACYTGSVSPDQLLEGAVADEAQVVGPAWGYGGVLG